MQPPVRGLKEGITIASWQARSGKAAAPPVSVVILTFNEEHNIEAALDSCAWCDDVHVLDSGSTDQTRQIAQRRGAKVWINKFQSFGQQRNWAIDNIPAKHTWQFHLDADERFTFELVDEMTQLLGSQTPKSPAESGFFVANQMILMDQWIKRASGYPAYQVRLFDKHRLRFIDVGHGQRESSAHPIGTLREPYLHYNFSKGLDEWFARHNKYSAQEARRAFDEMAGGADRGLVGCVLDLLTRLPGPAIERRRALKRLASRLPARGGLRRLHMLLIQGAILDGRAGWQYAKMIGLYEGMIALKLRDLQQHASSKTPEKLPRP
jgi:glycosyltransferase involved in cell wall biosynthesis